MTSGASSTEKLKGTGELTSERETTFLQDRHHSESDEYAEYIQNIVLQDILQGEYELLLENNYATELQSMADNLLSEYTDEAFQLMNTEVLALVEDIDRMDLLQENLDGIVPRIMSLSWITELKKIEALLQDSTSSIPVVNGTFQEADFLSSKQCSEIAKDLAANDSQLYPAVQTIEESNRLLESFESRFTRGRADAKEMNRVLLRCISSVLSRITKASFNTRSDKSA